MKINKVEYKGKVYNVESIHVYDGYVTICRESLANFNAKTIDVSLMDVEFIS